MKPKHWGWWALLVLLPASGPCRGQQLLSYAACVERGLQGNLQLKQALLDLEAATLQVKLQKAELLPKLNASLRNNTSVGRSVDPLTNTFIDRQFNSVNGSANSSVYLFEGLKTASAIKAARQEVAQNESQLQALKNELAVDVALVYIRINYLLELIKSQQQQVEASAQLVGLTRLKLAAGSVAESTLFKLLSQQATEQLEVVKSQNELTLAYLELRQLLNTQPGEEFQIRPLEYTALAEADFQPPLPAEVAQAVAAQPALVAKDHNAQRLHYQIAVTRSSRFPSLQLTGSLGSNYSNTNQAYDFSRQLNNNISYGTGFVLSLPLFNSFRYTLQVKESRLRYEQGLLQVEVERNRLTKVVQQAITEAQAAKEGWNAARQAEEYARKSYEADRLKFEYGTISVFEFNQAKAAYVQAQTDLFKAKYELILRAKLVGFYQGAPLAL